MSTNECEQCVNGGTGCINLIVNLEDGPRLIGVVHRRIHIRIELWDGSVQESTEGDFLLANATGYSSIGKFRVDKDAIAKLPIYKAE